MNTWPRQRQADRHSTLAKALERRRFGLSGQSRFGDPSAQLRELGIVHAARFYTMGAPIHGNRRFESTPRWRAALESLVLEREISVEREYGL